MDFNVNYVNKPDHIDNHMGQSIQEWTKHNFW